MSVSSSSPHIIRLRGPWQIEPLAHTVLLADGTTQSEPGSLPPATRCEVPSDWGTELGEDFRGRVRYTRRFGRPSGLSPGDTVMLVVEQIDWRGHVSLNGDKLSKLCFADSPSSVDITRLLDFRNELVIEVELPRYSSTDKNQLSRGDRNALPGGLIGEVRLEIFAGE